MAMGLIKTEASFYRSHFRPLSLKANTQMSPRIPERAAQQGWTDNAGCKFWFRCWERSIKDLVTRFSINGEPEENKTTASFFGTLTPANWAKACTNIVDHHRGRATHNTYEGKPWPVGRQRRTTRSALLAVLARSMIAPKRVTIALTQNFNGHPNQVRHSGNEETCTATLPAEPAMIFVSKCRPWTTFKSWMATVWRKL